MLLLPPPSFIRVTASRCSRKKKASAHGWVVGKVVSSDVTHCVKCHTRDRRLVCIEYSRRSLAHLARTLRAFLCNLAAFGLLAQYFLGSSVCRDWM